MEYSPVRTKVFNRKIVTLLLLKCRNPLEDFDTTSQYQTAIIPVPGSKPIFLKIIVNPLTSIKSY